MKKLREYLSTNSPGNASMRMCSVVYNFSSFFFFFLGGGGGGGAGRGGTASNNGIPVFLYLIERVNFFSCKVRPMHIFMCLFVCLSVWEEIRIKK